MTFTSLTGCLEASILIDVRFSYFGERSSRDRESLIDGWGVDCREGNGGRRRSQSGCGKVAGGLRLPERTFFVRAKTERGLA